MASGKIKYLVIIFIFLTVAAGLLVYGLQLQAQNRQLKQTLDIELAATPTATADIRSMLLVTANPGTTPAPTAMYIKVGSKGELVTQIQQRLISLGYLSGEADGQFGHGTQVAVITFQQQAGLDADGIVGSGTWAALFAENAPAFVPSAAPSPTATQSSARNG